MSAVGPQFHDFIKKLEENNDKLPTSITSRTFQPEFEFNNSTCYLCNGYYGPSFGEPVCVTCHAFLYPDIPSNLPSSYIFSETDDGDSGNDEPSELLYNDRRLTRALQLGLAPTWALRHEFQNSLDSETSPEDEASRPTAAANAAGPSRIISVRPLGYIRETWPSGNQGRGQRVPSRDQGSGSAGPSRSNGPSKDNRPTDHGMGLPGPSTSRDSCILVKNHVPGLAGQSRDIGLKKDNGLHTLGSCLIRDISSPAKDNGLGLAGHSRDIGPKKDHGSSSRDNSGSVKDHGLSLAGTSRDSGPSRNHGSGPPDPGTLRDNSGRAKDNGLGSTGQSRDSGPPRDHGMGPPDAGTSTDNSGHAKDHGLGSASPSIDNGLPRDHGMGPSDLNSELASLDHGLGFADQSKDSEPVKNHGMGPPHPVSKDNEAPRDQWSTVPNEGTSRDSMDPGIPGPSRDVSSSAGPSRDHGAQRDASVDLINLSSNEVDPTGPQRNQAAPAEGNRIKGVFNPDVNFVCVRANPIANEEREQRPLPPWSVARTLAALSTPRLPDNLAPGMVEQLPSEVLLSMFSYLDDLSLCACALVCARWWRLVRARVSQARWRGFAQRRWPLLRCMVNVLDWHKKYQSLVESCFCRHCLVQMCVLWQPPYEENAWRRNRLRNELKMLRNDPPEGCAATPLDPKCCHWQASVTGPVGSPYEGGVFYLYIQVPYSYPMSPPVVRFLTRILHPNVSRHGDVGIDSVHHNWSLALTLSKVLISIQSLLTDPYTAVCMEPAVGEMYVQDRVRFERIARRWTWRYAMHDVLANN